MHLFRVIIFGLLTALAGCGPGPGVPAGRRVSGGILLLKNPIESRDLRYADWLIPAGRMDTYARRRHLANDAGRARLFIEEFDRVTKEHVPGWRTVGIPTIKSVRLDNANGVELIAPEEQFKTCGIQYDIDPKLLAGRDVRLDLRFTCRSDRRVKALAGVSLSLLALDKSGEAHVIELPIVAGVTPGWEIQRYRLRFYPDVAAATLRVHLTKPGAICTLDSITIVGRQTLAGRKSVSTVTPTTQPVVRPVNFIVGGDFEIGQHSFFVSATKYWPNGDEMSLPLRWEFDDKSAVGDNSLLLYIADETGRVAFGPLDINSPSRMPLKDSSRRYLSFYARAERPTTMIVTLRDRKRTLSRTTFQLSEDYRRFKKEITITPQTYDQQIELGCTELLFDVLSDGMPEVNRCWLDAVALTDAPIVGPYVRSAPVEVGLFGPVPDPVDLAHLLDVKDPLSFGVRLVADLPNPSTNKSAQATSKPAGDSSADSKKNQKTEIRVGKLAVDVLDAWDRVVWTRTAGPRIPETGILNETIKLQLPRGYYRILATLWSAEPGESEIISQARLFTAVISLHDPVPLSNQFGLSAQGANVSMRTTHIGAGWVRMDLPAYRAQVRPGLYELTSWKLLVARCKRAQVEIVAGLTLPKSAPLWKMFLEQLLKNNEIQPIGAVVYPPTVSLQPTKEYLNQLVGARDLLAIYAPQTKLVKYLSGARQVISSADKPLQSAGEAWGFTCSDTLIPEKCESELEALGRHRRQGSGLWDISVPAHIGGAPSTYHQLPRDALGPRAGPVQLLSNPIDPVRSASKLLRSLLIRNLVGVRMVCSDASALTPVRSIYENHERNLHEKDLSPRVALVAFDLMASLLNDATIKRWIDIPDGSRLLYFEKDDGQAVVAAWRPFGISPTSLEFINLPKQVKLIDCLGTAETPVTRGNRRIIEVNEIVRYLIVPADQREALLQALDSVHIMIPTASRPAG